MPSIAGELEAGEAAGAARAIASRQRGPTRTYQVIQLGAILVGALGGFAFARATNGDPVVPIALGAGLASAVYLLLARRLALRQFRARMQDRGLSTRFALSFSVEAEGLTYRTGGVTKIAEWDAVTELFKSRNFWVFLVHMEPWVLPTRFFAGADDERAFVAQALSHMSEAARDRSAEAVRFVGPFG